MKHYIATVLILLATAACHLTLITAQKANAQQGPEKFGLDLPRNFGRFSQLGADIPISENVKKALQTSSILTRDYRAYNGRLIQLTVVHASATRGSLHFPEVCLVGNGWELQQQYMAPVGFSFTAKRLVLTKGPKNEAILYWFKTGDELTGNFFLNSWHWAREQIMFRTPSSTMIRLSTPVRQGDYEGGFQALEDFALQFAPLFAKFTD